jgi:hypothetical protein
MTKTDVWPVTALIPESVGAPIHIDDKQAALAIAVIERGNASLLDERWEKPGVYLLLDPLQVDRTFGAYIGQGTSLRARVKQHELGRDTWVRALLIRRDTTYGFTSADIGWLEGALWSLVLASERGIPSNKLRPMDDTLPPHDRAVLDTFLFPIRRILRLIGYSFEPPGETIVQTAKTRTNYNVTVADLINVGLVAVGQTLAFTYPGLPASAVVQPDGRLLVDGTIFDTPSGAAQKLRGGPTNGWAYWAITGPSGAATKSLAELRQSVLSSKAPASS